MKTKNDYLKEQGIDLEKDLSVGTYTKIRFAMKEYAKDYHESEVKKFRLGAVSGMLKCCSCGYEYEELIIAKDGNMRCKDCAF